MPTSPDVPDHSVPDPPASGTPIPVPPHASVAETEAVVEATPPVLPFAPPLAARPFIDPHAVANIPGQSPGTTEAVLKDYAAPAEKSASNVTGHPTENLQNFGLSDLAQFTKEGTFSSTASKDVHLFYVGRDDVHDILKYILSRVTISLYLNMFGFDDSELNNILMIKALNPAITMLITLDLSQAGGVHEKALLEADQKYNLAAYNTHFVIGQSATHQISHTKGFVADGRVAAEGSTNWSKAGEGTYVVNGQPGGVGYKAQNNTQAIITDPDTIIRFQTELIAEHMIALAQADKRAAKPLELTPATEALQQAAHLEGLKKIAAKKAPPADPPPPKP